ncbi:hypothetical protein KAR91_16350 [Candidatus Pacearchaeota archaeon]|nr:hypothetical protein [Candidatus Pacearchaeota archaeon]
MTDLTSLRVAGVDVLGGSTLPSTTGEYFFVDSSTGTDGNSGKSSDEPKGTLDGAVNACRANKGDVIVVMPNHAETVSATSIALDVAGITIVCLGNSEAQAVFTYSAAASTITVSADDIKFVGGFHQATKLDVASAFTVSSAEGFSLQGGKFEDTSAILNFLSIVTTTTTDNDADGLSVLDNSFYGLNTTPLAFISILGDIKDLTAEGNFVDSAATADVGHFITFAAKDGVGTRLVNNELIVVGATDAAVGIFLTGSGTAHTGIVRDNYVASLDTTSELIATAGTGLKYFNNYYTGVADKSGKLWPVVDAA